MPSNEPEANLLLGGFFIGDYIEVFAHDRTAWVGYNANYRSRAVLFEGPPIPQQDKLPGQGAGVAVAWLGRRMGPPLDRGLHPSLAPRRIHVVPVDTLRSSPFAQSLLFRWVAQELPIEREQRDGPRPDAAARLELGERDRVDQLAQVLRAEELRTALTRAAA